jgi:hypothetical protein
MIFRLLAGTAMAALVSGCCLETETYLEYRYANATDNVLTLVVSGTEFPCVAPDTITIPAGGEAVRLASFVRGKQSEYHPATCFGDSATAFWTTSSGADVAVSPADSAAWEVDRVEERCVVTFRCLLQVGPEDLVP